jgi:hypothetical protein
MERYWQHREVDERSFADLAEINHLLDLMEQAQDEIQRA